MREISAELGKKKAHRDGGSAILLFIDAMLGSAVGFGFRRKAIHPWASHRV